MLPISDNTENYVVFKDFGNSYILFKGKDGIFTKRNYRKGREAELRIRPIIYDFLKKYEGLKIFPLCDNIIGEGPDYYLLYGKCDIGLEVKYWDFKKGVKLSHYENEIKSRLEKVKWKILYMEGSVEIGPRIRLLLKKDKIILVRTKDKLKRVVEKILRKLENRKAGKNREVEVKKYVNEGFSWEILKFMKELMIKIIRIIGVLGNCVYEGIKGIWKGVILKRIFLGKTPRGIDLKSMRKEDFIEAGKTIIRIKGKG